MNKKMTEIYALAEETHKQAMAEYAQTLAKEVVEGLEKQSNNQGDEYPGGLSYAINLIKAKFDIK